MGEREYANISYIENGIHHISAKLKAEGKRKENRLSYKRETNTSSRQLSRCIYLFKYLSRCRQADASPRSSRGNYRPCLFQHLLVVAITSGMKNKGLRMREAGAELCAAKITRSHVQRIPRNTQNISYN